jgi:60 kDa SS-A/Ro ribonucleoprotein
MVNRNLFGTSRGSKAPATNTVNRAGGTAYKMSDKHALIQYAVTNCFNSTFYATAEQLLDEVAKICGNVEPEFIAKVAVYARQKGYMKDMPAYLTAQLVGRNRTDLVKRVFPITVDNGTQLRKFSQIVRSGAIGRKSFGTSTRNTIRSWLDNRSDEQLFRDSVGTQPSLADVIKMVHPKPANKEREAFYGYLLGKEYSAKNLPDIVKHYEAFKAGKTTEVPNVDFRYLTSLDLDTHTWREICRNAAWHMTRMNINTFMRHKVFEGAEGKTLIKLVAERLANEDEIKRARVFPYQLLVAYKNVDAGTPMEIQNALQEAMEIACQNVPAIEGNLVLCPDVSGSMRSAVTGDRGSATTVVTCHDISALVSAVYLRKNGMARVLPFEGHVVNVRLNPKDSIMTNAAKLASIGGGSTACDAPLHQLNQEKATVDCVVFISDNESWVTNHTSLWSHSRGTTMMNEWKALKARNKNAKMVCIDIQANATSQAPEHDADILNVGGWSDNVFDIINKFLSDDLSTDKLVGEIENIDLAAVAAERAARREQWKTKQDGEWKPRKPAPRKRTLGTLVKKAVRKVAKKVTKKVAKKRK